jgi:hypothetical protein
LIEHILLQYVECKAAEGWLETIARLVNFNEPIHIASPESPVTGLCEQIRRLVDEKFQLEMLLQTANAARDSLKDKLAQVAGKLREVVANHQALSDRYAKLVGITRQQDAFVRQTKRDQSCVLSRMRFLYPQLAAAPLWASMNQFLAEFPMFMVREAARYLIRPCRTLVRPIVVFLGKVRSMCRKLDLLLVSHWELRAHDEIYRYTLSILFPGTQDPGDGGAIRARLAKSQLLLTSVFRLIPDFPFEPPVDVYGLALALRRQLEAPAIVADRRQLQMDMEAEEAANIDPEKSFMFVLRNQNRQLKALWQYGTLLTSVIPPLADALGIARPLSDRIQLERILAMVKERLRWAEAVRTKLQFFRTRIDGVAGNLKASLPESVMAMIETWKEEGSFDGINL